MRSPKDSIHWEINRSADDHTDKDGGTDELTKDQPVIFDTFFDTYFPLMICYNDWYSRAKLVEERVDHKLNLMSELYTQSLVHLTPEDDPNSIYLVVALSREGLGLLLEAFLDGHP